MKLKRMLLLGALVVVAVVGIMVGLSLSITTTAEHPVVGATVTHGADAFGCVKCHTAPIPATSCSSCHAAPPTTIGSNTKFPHHSATNPPGGLTCQNCHASAGNDARYVNTPDATHTYCSNCHAQEHSTPQ